MTLTDTPTPELRSMLSIFETQLEATRGNKRQSQHLRIKIGAIKHVLVERGETL